MKEGLVIVDLRAQGRLEADVATAGNLIGGTCISITYQVAGYVRWKVPPLTKVSAPAGKYHEQ